MPSSKCRSLPGGHSERENSSGKDEEKSSLDVDETKPCAMVNDDISTVCLLDTVSKETDLTAALM